MLSIALQDRPTRRSIIPGCRFLSTKYPAYTQFTDAIWTLLGDFRDECRAITNQRLLKSLDASWPHFDSEIRLKTAWAKMQNSVGDPEGNKLMILYRSQCAKVPATRQYSARLLAI